MRQRLLINFKNICISSLLTIIGYIVLGFVVFTIIIGPHRVEEMSQYQTKWLFSIFVYILYSVSFYFISNRNRTETYSNHTEGFNIIEELKSYLSVQGKSLFAIYIVIAFLYEIGFYLPIDSIHRIFTFVFWGSMPFGLIGIPFIRALISLVVTCITAVLSVLFKSYIIYRRKL